MISLDSFEKEQQPLVSNCIDLVSRKLSEDLGERFSLILQDNIDELLLRRMEQLEEEIFTVENNVYSRKEILECLAEEDSILLLALVNNRVEGYVFGYEEDIEKPTVRGTDYFLDSAVVATRYERKGIGATVAGIVLLLLYLLGYRKIGLLTEEQDKTGRKLLSFYQRLGFEHIETTQEFGCAMKIELTGEKIFAIGEQFGLSVRGERFL